MATPHQAWICFSCKRAVGDPHWTRPILFAGTKFCGGCVATCPSCTVDVPRRAAVKAHGDSWICKLCWRYLDFNGFLPKNIPFTADHCHELNELHNDMKLQAIISWFGFGVLAPAKKDSRGNLLPRKTWGDIHLDGILAEVETWHPKESMAKRRLIMGGMYGFNGKN